MRLLTWLILGFLVLSGCTADQSKKVATNTSIGKTPSELTDGQLPPIEAGPYTVGAGDVLRINVFEEPGLTFEQVPVDSTGSVPFPLIGAVRVAGLTSQEISDEIARRLGQRYIVDPQVTVFVVSSASQRITVEGDVEKPGLFDIKGETTLLQAVALAEGPTNTAKLNEIIVFRKLNGGVYAAQFDLKAVRRGDHADPLLQGGDVVVVGHSSVKGLFRDLLQASPALTALFIRIF